MSFRCLHFVAGVSLFASVTCADIASEDWSGAANTKTWPEGWTMTWPQQWSVESAGGTPNLTTSLEGENRVGQINPSQTVRPYLAAVSVVDSTQWIDFKYSTTSATANNFTGLIARQVVNDPETAANETVRYTALLSNGAGDPNSTTISITRIVGTSTATLGTLAPTDELGNRINVYSRAIWNTLKFQVEQTSETLTTLRVKVWETGTAEPSGWSLTATDTNATMQNLSGHVGINHTTSSNRWYRYDNYSVIPEPATVGLLGVSGLILLVRRRRGGAR